MKIGCILLTYNRFSKGKEFLLQESVESFLRQDFKDRVLLICNDTPGQIVHVPSQYEDLITVFNFDERFPYLTDKIQRMIDVNEDVDYFCRWDDDDISLPHRLTYSMNKIRAGHLLEWRPKNYAWSPNPGKYAFVTSPGNTHVMSLWHRSVLDHFPDGKYPQKISGYEDQEFNAMLGRHSVPRSGWEQIPERDVTYIYRWGVSDRHLSGSPNLQGHYDAIGKEPIREGAFMIDPKWFRDYDKELHAYAGA